ncbi:hypothetical protein MMC09_003180 [Bachmanniomyces sp. S44760]|nr:hypothetical protein [Bachmanniomyces sp. S44760]
MSNSAQDEFDALFSQQRITNRSHPEDTAAHAGDTSRPSSDNENTPNPSGDEDEDEDEDDDDDDDTKASRTPRTMPSAVYTIPSTTTFDANTGPKGVIADAKSFEKARKRSFRQTLYAFSNGLSTSHVDNKKPLTSAYSREKSSSPDISASDDEDEFMRAWRANRLTELTTTNGHEPRRSRRQSPSKRRYGFMNKVDAVGYLDAIEKVAQDTVVVVCIYDEESLVSGLVEDALSALSRKHEFTRFVKLSYEEAEMDEEAVPAILAYRGGEIFANMVAVLDEMPAGQDLSEDNLEALLKRRSVL